jgi:RNA polymerase sigma-70 factor (ECF subfamily)
MDEREFDEFYTGSLRRVTAQIYALIGDWHEAQECTQEAFARAWAHRGKLERSSHPDAWVRTTAHRLAISRWRRVVRGRRPTDRATALPTESPPVNAEHVALVEALKLLPHAQRTALVLHHLVDLPIAAVALETGVAVGTVKARLSRGRAALAQLLGEHPPAPAADRRRV